MKVLDIISNNNDFIITGLKIFNLGENDSQEVSIQFKPLQEGIQSGIITIVHNASNSPSKINVSGSGFNYPTTFSLNYTNSFANITDSTNYKIIGLPGSLVIPVSQIVNGNYNKDWKVFWDNGKEGDKSVYLDSRNNFSFATGKAYWILSKNPINISNMEVNSVQLNKTDNSYSIPLHSGWNIISNPYERNIKWNDVLELNKLSNNHLIYAWNNGWSYPNPSMLPYEGYYFNNDSNYTFLKIPYDPDGTINKAKYNSTLETHNFLSLMVKDKIGKDSEIFIGIDSTSKDGIDDKDFYKPPFDFGDIGISLIKKELPPRERRLFIEQRPKIGNGQEYDIEINTIPNNEVEIKAEGLTSYKNFDIYLLDTRLNNIYNLKENSKIKLNLAHRNNDFKLFIGSGTYIDAVKEKIQLAGFILYQNYPNPFNPTTTMRFSLPNPDIVTLKIYNIIGQELQVLLNNQQLSKGNHEIQFNGNRLASGIYIMSITTSKFKQQKKIVLIK